MGIDLPSSRRSFLRGAAVLPVASAIKCASTLPLASTGTLVSSSSPSARPPRTIRVTIVCFTGPTFNTGADNVKRMGELLASAALDKPDIALLPENFPNRGIALEQWAANAEPIPGPATQMAATLASENQMYVLCPILEQDGDQLYVTQVVLGRDGTILGKYRKMFPTVKELGIGVRPGHQLGVFDVDFGRIGLMTCMDLSYPQVSRGLGQAQVDIVFWASSYPGGLPLQTCAYENRCFVATAQCGQEAYIFDKTGQMITETGRYWNTASADLDLDETVFSTDFNVDKLDAIRAKYGPWVIITFRHDDGVFMMRSAVPNVTVAQLIQEFGLEPLDAYLLRTQQAAV